MLYRVPQTKYFHYNNNLLGFEVDSMLGTIECVSKASHTDIRRGSKKEE